MLVAGTNGAGHISLTRCRCRFYVLLVLVAAGGGGDHGHRVFDGVHRVP